MPEVCLEKAKPMTAVLILLSWGSICPYSTLKDATNETTPCALLWARGHVLFACSSNIFAFLFPAVMQPRRHADHDKPTFLRGFLPNSQEVSVYHRP